MQISLELTELKGLTSASVDIRSVALLQEERELQRLEKQREVAEERVVALTAEVWHSKNCK